MASTHSPTDRLDTITFHLHGPTSEARVLDRPVLVVLVGLLRGSWPLNAGLAGGLVPVPVAGAVAVGRRTRGRRRGGRGGRMGVAGGGERVRLGLGELGWCHAVGRTGEGQAEDMYRLKARSKVRWISVERMRVSGQKQG